MKTISEIFSNVVKIITDSPRFGTILFLTTLAILVLIHYRLTPLQHLDQTWILIIWIGFILGACIVLYEVSHFTLELTKREISKFKTARLKKRLALIQLNENNREYINILTYLKTKNMKTFSAQSGNRTLYRMVHSHLIDYEKSDKFNNAITYYVVPHYIWERIEPIDARRLPSSPPWTPGPNSWMGN